MTPGLRYLPGHLALPEQRALRSLDASGATALASLALPNSALESLAARGCSALVRLELGPRAPGGMLMLLLANCSALRDVSVAPRAPAASAAASTV